MWTGAAGNLPFAFQLQLVAVARAPHHSGVAAGVRRLMLTVAQGALTARAAAVDQVAMQPTTQAGTVGMGFALSRNSTNADAFA